LDEPVAELTDLAASEAGTEVVMDLGSVGCSGKGVDWPEGAGAETAGEAVMELVDASEGEDGVLGVTVVELARSSVADLATSSVVCSDLHSEAG